MILKKENSKITIVEKSDCIRYLQSRLEEIALIRLCGLQNTNTKNTEKTNFVDYFKKENSRIWGYFQVPKPEKITIYNKYQLKGYLYNSFELKKIVSYFIINPTKACESQYCEVAINDKKKTEFAILKNFFKSFTKDEEIDYKESVDAKINHKLTFWSEIHDFILNLYGSTKEKQEEELLNISD